MKAIFVLVLFTVFACDAPQRVRYPSTGNADLFSEAEGGGGGFSDSGGSSGSGQGGDDPNPENTEPGFENCNVAHQYSAGSVGSFGVCQSETDERQFKASFAQSDLSVGTCFVPMHIQGSQSFNVGRAECVHNQANRNYYATLYKNRSESINGIMVLKASSVNAFMQCMSAKADYINGHPGCLYDSNCMNNANQYASQVCASFVQNHGNHYRQVQFN